MQDGGSSLSIEVYVLQSMRLALPSLAYSLHFLAVDSEMWMLYAANAVCVPSMVGSCRIWMMVTGSI